MTPLFPALMSSADRLDQHHYLGSSGARGVETYTDRWQTVVISRPTSRRIPVTWLELSRWCLVPGHPPNAGSTGWASVRIRILGDFPDVTTIVSYSDPNVGHTGALYRACNWLWAPVWHVLRPPPTGGGVRSGRVHPPKHRWVDPLRPDPDREQILRLKDAALSARYPSASYREPSWKRGRRTGGGGDYSTWVGR